MDYIIILVIIPIIVGIYGYMMGYMIILVGGIPTPLKNMSSSGGMMKFPISAWEVIIQSCSSHHQPENSPEAS